ncbi:MAG TPA: hypothetical protein VG815_16935 [Chloroflexota bacterium]|nr:hypothetical protein [Chloroflexota bacterium]
MTRTQFPSTFLLNQWLRRLALTGSVALSACATTSTGQATFLGLTVAQVQAGIAATCSIAADSAPIAALLSTSIPGVATAEQLYIYLCQAFAPAKTGARFGAPGAPLIAVIATPTGRITLTGTHL